MIKKTFILFLIQWSLTQIWICFFFFPQPTYGYIDITKIGISSPEQHRAVCTDACVDDGYALPGIPAFCGLMSCYSKSYRYKRCKHRAYVRIKSAVVYYRRSDSECTYHDGARDTYEGKGGIYGYENNVIWVDNGCRASFRICYTLWSPYLKTVPMPTTSSTKSTSLATMPKPQSTSKKLSSRTRTTRTTAPPTTRKIKQSIRTKLPVTLLPLPKSSSKTTLPLTGTSKWSDGTSIPSAITSTTFPRNTTPSSNSIYSSVGSSLSSVEASHTTPVPSNPITKTARWSTRTTMPSAVTTNETAGTTRPPTRTDKQSAVTISTSAVITNALFGTTHSSTGTDKLPVGTTHHSSPTAGITNSKTFATRTAKRLTTTSEPSSQTINSSARTQNHISRSSLNPLMPTSQTPFATHPQSTANSQLTTTKYKSVSLSSKPTPCIWCMTNYTSLTPSGSTVSILHNHSTSTLSVATSSPSFPPYSSTTNGHKRDAQSVGPEVNGGENTRGFPVTGMIIVAVVVILGFIILGVAIWRKRHATEDTTGSEKLVKQP